MLYNLAALVWRIRGEAYQAIECLRRALHFSPFLVRDIALVSLANVLHVSGAPNEALVVADAAVDVCDTLYASHITRGNILATLGEFVAAHAALARAVRLNPDLRWGRDLLEAVTVKIKVDAVAQRRRSEIALRKVTMVLTDDLTWDDFDYEAIDRPCLDAVCKEFAQCSDVDGKCHCNEGYLAVNGECTPDHLCADGAKQCKDNSVCRAGRCYCKVGFMVRDNACVEDPCAGITCVDHASCNSDRGVCECDPGFQAFGAECVTSDCLGVSCKQFSFCQKGLCYCHVGYHPNYDVCVPDEPCAKSRCPKNASCRKDDGHCRCDNGYMADIHNNLCLPADSDSVNALEEPGSNMPPPSVALPGQQADLSQADMQPFERDDWVSDASCTPSLRTLPEWNDFASTFLPPTSRHGRSLRDVLDLQADLPAAGDLKQPRCDLVGQPIHSAHTMDHIVGIVDRFDEDMAATYGAETGLQEIATHLLGYNMDYRELGHYISLALEGEDESWVLYSLASLYWRVVGHAGNALECVRKSLHLSSYEDKDVAMINAANVLHRGGRLQDATTFAHLALLMSTRQKTITHFTLANVLAARALWDDAAFHYEQSLRHQPGFELALHTLHRIRCVQFVQRGGLKDGDRTAREDHVSPEARALSEDEQVRMHLQEARKLRLRLQALKKLMEEHGEETPESDRMRAQLQEAEHKLNMVLARSPALSEAMAVIEAQAAAEASAELPPLVSQAPVGSGLANDAGPAGADRESVDTSEPSAATKQYTDENGQRVIVVEYPSSPSISSLISAVEEMMDAEDNLIPQVFDDPGWPDLETCKRHGTRGISYSSTVMPVEAKGVNSSNHVDLSTELLVRPEDFAPPLCVGPVPEKKVHTLQHLRGVASRDELVMAPEYDLATAIQLLHGYVVGSTCCRGYDRGVLLLNLMVSCIPPSHLLRRHRRADAMPLDEFGERVRQGLQRNSTSWVLQNLAAVYWRIQGNATQVRSLGGSVCSSLYGECMGQTPSQVHPSP